MDEPLNRRAVGVFVACVVALVAWFASEAQAEPIFSDGFERPDASSIGGSWLSGAGYSITGGRLANDSGGTAVAVSPDLGTVDQAVEMVIATAGDSSSQGVIARSNSSGSSFYLWRNNGVNWQLFANVDGSFTGIGPQYAADAADGDVVRLVVDGTTIEGWVNGVLRADVEDSSITAGSHAGIRTSGSSTSRYDGFVAGDLAVATPTPTPTPTPSETASPTPSATASPTPTVTVTAPAGLTSVQLHNDQWTAVLAAMAFLTFLTAVSAVASLAR